jgi:hypothetical protein
MYTHPTIYQQLAQAQLADKHRHGQRGALARATRRAERTERRTRRAARQAPRLRAQLEA